jgi:hydroxyethylthiazole kinase-like uncharacterized protein yjeF
MDVLSLKDMVTREEEAFRSGFTAAALMEAAIYPRADDFLVLVGKGNNGGDGLVVARHLAKAGKNVRVVLAAPEDQLGELPGAKVQKLRSECPTVEILPWREDCRFPNSGGVVIDGLLGVQARGALRGVLAQIVVKLNSARVALFFRTVALDLPTGLAAFEDGKAPQDRNAAVIADITIAVGFAKDVLIREALSGWVGRLEVVAWSQAQAQFTHRQVLVPTELAHLLPRRNALSYKGDYGKLAIVSGNLGFTGALCPSGTGHGSGTSVRDHAGRRKRHCRGASSARGDGFGLAR